MTTHSTSRTRRGLLIGAIVAAFCAAALLLWARSQLSPSSFGCSRYLELAASDEFRESIYNWAQREYRDVSVQMNALPEGYRLSAVPASIEDLDVSGLEFFPVTFRNQKVKLEVDASGLVEWVYVGRSGRAGIIVILRAAPDDLRVMPAVVEKYGPVAVYCNV